MAMPERHIILIKESICKGLENELLQCDIIGSKLRVAESVAREFSNRLKYVNDNFDPDDFVRRMNLSLHSIAQEARIRQNMG